MKISTLSAIIHFVFLNLIIYLGYLIKENLLILRQNNQKQPEERINMDKFLAKVKGYRNKMDKKSICNSCRFFNRL